MLVRVTSAEVIGDFILRLAFSDGTDREIDLEASLWGPVFEPLRDPEFFARVSVDEELGTIVWPNGADMDPVVLHGPAQAGSDENVGARRPEDT
ncbi:MAG: DUF2442 domain-containing protein [Actinobacteria bacterium]|nr:DUF2442 domain-containing protein [Actinomycetota bacterium]